MVIYVCIIYCKLIDYIYNIMILKNTSNSSNMEWLNEVRDYSNIGKQWIVETNNFKGDILVLSFVNSPKAG